MRRWSGVCLGLLAAAVVGVTGAASATTKQGHTTATTTAAPPGSWSSPYRLGTTVTSDNWHVRVLGGPINADDVMEGAGSPPPAAGTQYALVHVVLTNVASTTQYLGEFLTNGPVIVQGKTRITYVTQATGPGWPIHYLNLMDIGSTDPGETVTGYLSYLIKAGDAPHAETWPSWNAASRLARAPPD